MYKSSLLLLFVLSIFQSFGQEDFVYRGIIDDDLGGRSKMQVVDVNADGLLDITFTTSEHYSGGGPNAGFVGRDSLGWYENFGDGNFSDLNLISNTGHGIREFAFSDLNGDSHLDVIYNAAESGTLYWVLNQGNGEFGELNIFPGSYSGSIELLCTDWDSDGDTDVLFVNSNGIGMYENSGEGLFTSSFITLLEFSDFNGANSFGDFDNDGDLDFLHFGSGVELAPIYITENLGAEFGETSTVGFGQDTYFTEVLDYDYDGDLDIVFSNFIQPEFFWLKNQGNLNFQILDVNVELDLEISDNLHFSDLDNDGEWDFLMGDWIDHQIHLYQNIGGNFFEPAQIVVDDFNYSMRFTIGDLDQDGDDDIAAIIEGNMVWYENKIGEGCTDPTACNYMPLAQEDDGSCCYELCGCTNVLAFNFDPAAVCSIPVCNYKVTGTVFHDENLNGIFDESELPLAGRMVTIEELGVSSYSNNQGNYELTIPDGGYTLETEIDEFYPIFTTENPLVVNTLSADTYSFNFGLASDLPEFSMYSAVVSPFTFMCSDQMIQSYYFSNQSNVPLSCEVEIQISDLFPGFTPLTEGASIAGNTVTYSFGELLPGQGEVVQFLINTPSANFIGQTMINSLSVLFYHEGELVGESSDFYQNEVLCSYDPNDKQADPIGYTDNHYLLENTTQEFLIRFQNNGNAPAYTVQVLDEIDPNYSLESFEIKGSSHSMITSVDQNTREISFVFEDINLPDSLSDPAGSQGFVLFSLDSKENLTPGTILYNTAEIYFDNNDPIITNTTWTEIHECGEEGTFIFELIDESCLEETYQADIVFFLTEYGCQENCRSDLDNNGLTGSSDLALLLSLFGQQCN